MTQAPAHRFVRDLSELRSALLAMGENVQVFDEQNATVVFGTHDGLESTIQLIWSEERRALHVVEVYGSVVPHERRQEIFNLVAFANTKVNMPAFQVRKNPGGWKVAFSTCAFVDHEGRLSTRAVTELLLQTRLAGHEIRLIETMTGPAEAEAAKAPEAPKETPPTKQAAAAMSEDAKKYAAFASRAVEKLAKVPPPPTFPPITIEQRAALAAAFGRDLPRFGPRVATAKIEDYGHPFFAKVRVLRLEAKDAPEVAYAAWTSFGAIALSGNPVGLIGMCADERPAYADDPDLSIILGNMAAAWTSAGLAKATQLTSIDDIPFRRSTTEDAALEADVRRKFGERIHAPRVEAFDGGTRVTMWIVSEGRLRRRVSEVRPNLVTVKEENLSELALDDRKPS